MMPTMTAALVLSEEVLARGRGLIERLEIVGEVVTEALLEENRKIKAFQDEKAAGEREPRQRIVQRILLRKILCVDRGDSGKLQRGVKALMETVVTIALSVRADGVERHKPTGGGHAAKGTNASTALKLVGAQLDVAEQRLCKIELRAAQLQLIGGPRLNGVLNEDSGGTDAPAEALAGGDVAGEAAALALLADHPARGMSRKRLLCLGSIVAEMQALESSVEFHTALLAAHRKLTAGENSQDDANQKIQPLQYSRANFAYGSTPHSSWLALFQQCTPLRAAVDDMLALRGVSNSRRSVDEYCVFGSSLGWLCFYGCLTFGLRCTGYELVQPLVALSKRVAERHGIAESVTFHHMDMLDADLRRVRILVLTSHVWDVPLLQRLDAKLAREVPPVHNHHSQAPILALSVFS